MNEYHRMSSPSGIRYREVPFSSHQHLWLLLEKGKFWHMVLLMWCAHPSFIEKRQGCLDFLLLFLQIIWQLFSSEMLPSHISSTRTVLETWLVLKKKNTLRCHVSQQDSENLLSSCRTLNFPKFFPIKSTSSTGANYNTLFNKLHSWHFVNCNHLISHRGTYHVRTKQKHGRLDESMSFVCAVRAQKGRKKLL